MKRYLILSLLYALPVAATEPTPQAADMSPANTTASPQNPYEDNAYFDNLCPHAWAITTSD